MPRETTRAMIDRLLDGGLDRYLAEQRAAGLSNEDIAYQLRVRLDVSVTAETVRKWAESLGLTRGSAA